MQLKKLELKGFKSFGEAAKVEFDEGVTGIVGPNGCGKSNVVDAIRWVLGEQKTRSLRSDKMENIIFNGTKLRKGAQTAQVSLTFDNTKGILPSEYAQVCISRRYHRSGESEYLINDVRCRLKDIQNLFLDTGIGSDSYAIIELKKVDEILSDKENSRRDLFEKAAGISKYKRRKKESLARLDSVDKDLNRVGDLLYEIEKSLRSLERQAKQAERYFVLKEKYRDHSLAYARKALNRYNQDLDRLKGQIQVENDRQSQWSQEVIALDQELEAERKKLEHFEQAMQYKQKLYNEHIAKLRNRENEKKVRQEKLFFLNEKIEKTRGQIQADIEGQSQSRQKRQRLDQEFENAEKIREEARLTLDQLKTSYLDQKQKTEELQIRLKSQEELLRSRQNQLQGIAQDFEVKRTRLNDLKRALEESAQQNQALNHKVELDQDRLIECEQDLQEVKAEVLDLQKKEERKVLEVSEKEEEVQVLRDQLSALARKRDARQNEYELTKSFLDNMDGFSDAIQFLHQNPNWGQDTPLLADLIICEEHYRAAIESYLKPWLNYYVVQEEEEAWQAWRLLAEAQKGKAHFFILDKLSNLEVPESFLEKSSSPSEDFFFSGIDVSDLKNKAQSGPTSALEIISGEARHLPLLYFLLKDLYILEQKEDFEQISAKDKTQNNYVSRQGDILQGPYHLGGGSVGQSEGKRLGGVKNLERLEMQVRDFDQEIQQIQENLDFHLANLKSLKSNQSLKTALQDADKRLKQINNEYIALKSRKEQLLKIMEDNAQRYTEAQESIAHLEEEIQASQPKVQNQQGEMDELRERIENLREEFNEEQSKLQEQSTQLNQENLLFYQKENQSKNLQREKTYLEEELEKLNQRLRNLEQELTQSESDLEKLLESEENYDEDLEDLSAQSEDYEKNLRSVEKDYYQLRGQRNDKEKLLRQKQELKEKQGQVIRELENKNHAISLELTSLRERLSVEFGIEASAIQMAEISEEVLDLEESELKEKSSVYKQRMDNIGTINAMAMQDYEEQKERYDFIDKQKKDLEESKKALLKTIEETEAFARNAFMEAYESIRENFIKVFRSLFSSEDQADLQLSDPENPLESKIEIIAQPKGKKPLTIDQLSGGEKTLTATSLLFALYLLKPAPFCIFDEVDAPLDDVNTDKFNNIIREFSQNSQFILVTHNKRTMSMCDVLYGVVLPEGSVSMIAPVSFREAESVLDK